MSKHNDHDALVLLAFALLFALVNVVCRALVGFTDIRSELAAWALLIIAVLKLFDNDDDHYGI